VQVGTGHIVSDGSKCGVRVVIGSNWAGWPNVITFIGKMASTV
jgi:hypothetical protein